MTTDELEAQAAKIAAPLLALPPAQRHALIGKLWDSLSENDVSPPSWLLPELQRRRAQLQENPDSALAWNAIQAAIKQKHGI